MDLEEDGIILLSKTSNVATLFVDGIRVGTATWNSNYSSTNLRIGNATYSAGSAEGMLGYIQDVRLYDGVAKYSASADGEQAFIVPSTDPDIVPDAPSGVGVKTKLDKVTDGAVDFTGSNQYLKTNASSADFVFGTGDFTVEMMLYNRETAGKGFIHLSDTAGGLKPTAQVLLLSTRAVITMVKMVYSEHISKMVPLVSLKQFHTRNGVMLH